MKEVACFGDRLVLAQFTVDGGIENSILGTFVFVCKIRRQDEYYYLSHVRNVPYPYWYGESSKNGLGCLANTGPQPGDKIEVWPDVIISADKLQLAMLAEGWPSF